jgi:hypothetical protein
MLGHSGTITTSTTPWNTLTRCERGWQTPQEVPDVARRAWERLIAAGFTRHLIAE